MRESITWLVVIINIIFPKRLLLQNDVSFVLKWCICVVIEVIFVSADVCSCVHQARTLNIVGWKIKLWIETRKTFNSWNICTFEIYLNTGRLNHMCANYYILSIMEATFIRFNKNIPKGVTNRLDIRSATRVVCLAV